MFEVDSFGGLISSIAERSVHTVFLSIGTLSIARR